MGKGLYASGTYKLDSKGRIFIPAKQRHLFGEEAILTVWPGPSLILMPFENFKDWEKQYFSGIEFFEAMGTQEQKNYVSRFKRIIYGYLKEQKIDKSGRVLIPKDLLEYAQIEEEVRLIGYGLYYLIWNPEIYEQNIRADLEEFKRIEI